MNSQALLTLAQWLSPAFPVGAFAFSYGLETAVREGRIGDARDLQNWLEDLCALGSIRADIVLLAASFHGDPEADRVARAFQPSAERLEEARHLGSAFVRTVRAVWGVDPGDVLYPVAVGRAAALKDLPLDDTAALYVQAFAANLVSVAIRMVPIGQTDGQAVLAALAPACEALGQAAPTFTLADLANATFLSDIAAMRHETQSPRIFQS